MIIDIALCILELIAENIDKNEFEKYSSVIM